MGIRLGGIVSWVKANKGKVGAAVGVVGGLLADKLPIADAVKAIVDIFAGK